MKAMVATKGACSTPARRPRVPSPTAATLHALHYLCTSVADVQAALAAADGAGDYAAHHADILTAPIMAPKQRSELSAAEIADELDNNAVAPGYVTRWWAGRRLLEGADDRRRPADGGPRDAAHLVAAARQLAPPRRRSDADVLKSLHRIAPLVDEQNAADPSYQNLAPHFDGPEWHAAIELIWGGLTAPNGYTEPTLTARERKALDAGTATARRRRRRRRRRGARRAAAPRAQRARAQGRALDLELKDAARDAAEAAAASGGVLEPGPSWRRGRAPSSTPRRRRRRRRRARAATARLDQRRAVIARPKLILCSRAQPPHAPRPTLPPERRETRPTDRVSVMR